MTYNEKKSLYESIMRDVAKIVKRNINEMTGDRHIYNLKNARYSQIVDDMFALMNEHGVDVVDIAESNATPAYINGYYNGEEISMDVMRVYIEDGRVMYDCALDIDTEEVANSNEDGDISDAYPVYDAKDFDNIVPSITDAEHIYDSMKQVLVYGK